MPPFPMLLNQMRAAQQAQVFGDGRTGDGKSSGNFPGGLAAAAKKIEDSAASGIGQGFKGPRGQRICNRTVTHNT
jgi:hypothetical protein